MGFTGLTSYKLAKIVSCDPGTPVIQHHSSHIRFDDNAYTIVATYSNEVMRFYALHPRNLVEYGSPVRYYMTCLALFGIGNAEMLRAAVIAYRDWAKDRRDEFIKAANERVILI